jgi:hypothetical protein
LPRHAFIPAWTRPPISIHSKYTRDFADHAQRPGQHHCPVEHAGGEPLPLGVFALIRVLYPGGSIVWQAQWVPGGTEISAAGSFLFG